MQCTSVAVVLASLPHLYLSLFGQTAISLGEQIPLFAWGFGSAFGVFALAGVPTLVLPNRRHWDVGDALLCGTVLSVVGGIVAGLCFGFFR